MSAILNSVSHLEKELILLEGTINNIYLFDIGSNEVILNLKFKDAKEFDTKLICGLTSTINEFGGKGKNRELRTIKLEKLKIMFTRMFDMLLVFSVDPEYVDDQFRNAIFTLFDTFEHSFEFGGDEFSQVNEAAISTQLILSFLSEEVLLEMNLGPVVQIYPYKMREIAELRSDNILGSQITAPIDDLDEMASDDGSPNSTLDSNVEENDSPELFSTNEALFHLLDKFVSTFSDALQITLIRFTPEGTIHKVTAGSLDQEIEERLYDTVVGMINEIFTILSKSEEIRTLDLEDKWIYFQFVSHRAFMYVTVENRDVLSLMRPLVERVSKTIANLFPQD